MLKLDEEKIKLQIEKDSGPIKKNQYLSKSQLSINDKFYNTLDD